MSVEEKVQLERKHEQERLTTLRMERVRIEREKTAIQNFTNTVERITTSWKVINRLDEMTDKKVCGIKSYPQFLKGKYPVSISITGQSLEHLFVAITSDKTKSGIAELFHNNKNGLGIRVDSNEFIQVSKTSNQTAMLFTENDSEKLIEQFKHSKKAKLRVRFWPYDETIDTPSGIDLSQFTKSMKLLKQCIDPQIPR